MLAMPPMSGTNLATNPGQPRFGKLKVLCCCCLVAKLCPTPCEHGLQCQASLPFTISLSLLRLMSISRWCYPNILFSVTPFSCPQFFPSIRIFLKDTDAFPFHPYCSWGSQGKHTGAVCHSLLQCSTLCQSSPLWPVCLGWPGTTWLIASSSYSEPLRYARLWSMKRKGTYQGTDLSFGEEWHLVAPRKKNKHISSLTKRRNTVGHSWQRIFFRTVTNLQNIKFPKTDFDRQIWTEPDKTTPKDG